MCRTAINNEFILFHLDLLIVWLSAILSENMPTKNMKLLMLNVLVDDMGEIPTRPDVKIPIFKIAFADSSSNAKSNPLIKFAFSTLLLKAQFS